MGARTATEKKRSGIRLMIIGTLMIVAGFGGWWLVESTNPVGEHDAQLLPLFGLIPLLIGIYRLLDSSPRA